MSKRHTTHYPEEFKLSSAKLAYESSQPVSQTAKDLGIHPSTLHGWVEKHYPNKLSREKITLSEAEIELKQLQKELHKVKQERDILKKAAACVPQAQTNLTRSLVGM
jgi:transposase